MDACTYFQERFDRLTRIKRHFEKNEAKAVEPSVPGDFFEDNQVMPAIARCWRNQQTLAFDRRTWGLRPMMRTTSTVLLIVFWSKTIDGF
jgi:homoserine trans-succinylase